MADEDCVVDEIDEDIRYNDVINPETPPNTDEEWFEFGKEDHNKMFEPKNIGKNRLYLAQTFIDNWKLLDAIFLVSNGD